MINDLFKVCTSTKEQAVTIFMGRLGYLSLKLWREIDEYNPYMEFGRKKVIHD